jgi:N-ethylmaleimide reductase
MAEATNNSALANFMAFGRPFINNPDLVVRLANNWPYQKDQTWFVL